MVILFLILAFWLYNPVYGLKTFMLFLPYILMFMISHSVLNRNPVEMHIVRIVSFIVVVSIILFNEMLIICF
jgi:hypothetical protein